jgi:hypothetical protein
MTEAIARRLLNKHLSLFIKGYDSRQLKLSVIGGKCRLENLEMKDEILQEILCIAGLNFLTGNRGFIRSIDVRVPISALGSEPVVLSISSLDIDLEEVPHMKATTKIIETYFADEFGDDGDSKKDKKDPKDGKPKKYGLGDKIGDGIRVEIERISLRLQTLGLYRYADRMGPWTPPRLLLELRSFTLFTTNAEWDVVPLKEALPKYRKGVSELFVYKFGTIKNISIRLAQYPDVDDFSTPILDGLTATIKLCIKKRSVGGDILDIAANVFVDPLQLDLRTVVLKHLLQFVGGFGFCFGRDDFPTSEEQKEAERQTALGVASARAAFLASENESKLQPASQQSIDLDDDDESVLEADISAAIQDKKPVPRVIANVHIPSIRIVIDLMNNESLQVLLQKFLFSSISGPESPDQATAQISFAHLGVDFRNSATGFAMRIVEPMRFDNSYPGSSVFEQMAGCGNPVSELIPFLPTSMSTSLSAALATSAPDGTPSVSQPPTVDGDVLRISATTFATEELFNIHGAKVDVRGALCPLQIKLPSVLGTRIVELMDVIFAPPSELPPDSTKGAPPKPLPLFATLSARFRVLGLSVVLFDSTGMLPAELPSPRTFLRLAISSIDIFIHPHLAALLHQRERQGKYGPLEMLRDVSWDNYVSRVGVKITDVAFEYYNNTIQPFVVFGGLDVLLNAALDYEKPEFAKDHPANVIQLVATILKVKLNQAVLTGMLEVLLGMVPQTKQQQTPPAPVEPPKVDSSAAGMLKDVFALGVDCAEKVLTTFPALRACLLLYGLDITFVDNCLPSLKVSNLQVYAETFAKEQLDDKDARFPVQLSVTGDLEQSVPLQRRGTIQFTFLPKKSMKVAKRKDYVQFVENAQRYLVAADQVAREIELVLGEEGVEYLRSQVAFIPFPARTESAEEVVDRIKRTPSLWSSPQKEGFIYKQGGSHKSWKKRYFRLADDLLVYFDDLEAALSLGVAPLGVLILDHDSACVEITDAKALGLKKGLFPFFVRAQNRTMNFYCSSEAERIDWVRAINQHVEVLKSRRFQASPEEKSRQLDATQRKLKDLKVAVHRSRTSLLESTLVSGLGAPSLATEVDVVAAALKTARAPDIVAKPTRPAEDWVLGSSVSEILTQNLREAFASKSTTLEDVDSATLAKMLRAAVALCEAKDTEIARLSQSQK